MIVIPLYPMVFNAQVNVSGSIEAPLTVHVPPQTVRTVVSLMAIGTGLSLVTQGVGKLTNKQPHRRKVNKGPADIERGLNPEQASPEYSDDDDDDTLHRQSLCKRFSCSQGIKLITAGLTFITGGTLLEYAASIFGR